MFLQYKNLFAYFIIENIKGKGYVKAPNKFLLVQYLLFIIYR